MIRTLSIAMLCLPGLARADALELAFPVDCDLGQDCFIQNYVDHDPGPGRLDSACGHLTYDGHSGTDIALYTDADLDRDVAVFAVAPGTVRATRDGMPDIHASDPEAPDLAGRSCGNAVIVAHESGWESRYCHLKRGSITVRSGDAVSPSTQLGAVGLSGRTEFPHLHLTLVQDGETVDPFRPSSATACGPITDTLWKDALLYSAAEILTAGASAEVPSFDAVKAGTAGRNVLSATAPSLVFWAHLYGAKVGDELHFDIRGPEGAFLDQTVTLDRDQVRIFRAVGRKRRDATWPPGRYSADIQLLRDGVEIDEIQAVAEIR